jgi:hypothetical protein
LELKAWKFVSSLRALKKQQDDERELEGLGGRPAEVHIQGTFRDSGNVE